MSHRIEDDPLRDYFDNLHVNTVRLASRASGEQRLELDTEIKSCISLIGNIQGQDPEAWQTYKRLDAAKQEARSKGQFNPELIAALHRLMENPTYLIVEKLSNSMAFLRTAIFCAKELNQPFDPYPKDLELKVQDLLHS